MAFISVGDANAWTDKVKLNLTTLDTDLESSISTQVLARVSQAYDVSSWTTSNNTPSLIKKIIAMMYTGWLYQRTYSEDEETNSYGLLLLAQADSLMTGIVEGSLPLLGGGGALNPDEPVFYPTDLSSAQSPTHDDPSLGGPVFSMGKVW